MACGCEKRKKPLTTPAIPPTPPPSVTGEYTLKHNEHEVTVTFAPDNTLKPSQPPWFNLWRVITTTQPSNPYLLVLSANGLDAVVMTLKNGKWEGEFKFLGKGTVTLTPKDTSISSENLPPIIPEKPI